MLAERGHTRIGFVGWAAGSGTGDDRRAGWERVVRELVDDHTELDVRIDDGVAEGAQAARTLRSRGATALVCASDSLALGALPVFAAAGDPFVPVVGFDDTPVARAVGLSSVAQPVEQAARFCIDTLVALLTQPDAAASSFQQLLVPTLAVRERAAF